MGMAKGKESAPDEVRKDLWFVTDVYLEASVRMVAEQFINEENVVYDDRAHFIARATYVLRQHCPLTYSYYFEHARVEVLPAGTVDVLLEIIREQKPDFLPGGGLIANATPK